MWSNCADAGFHMTFAVCVSAAKSVAPPLVILPGKQLNRDVLDGCDIEVTIITTEPKGFINYNLFFIWLELFANYVPDSVVRPIVLVYDECASHYNGGIVKKIS